jgi:hypothetical protein
LGFRRERQHLRALTGGKVPGTPEYAGDESEELPQGLAVGLRRVFHLGPADGNCQNLQQLALGHGAAFAQNGRSYQGGEVLGERGRGLDALDDGKDIVRRAKFKVAEGKEFPELLDIGSIAKTDRLRNREGAHGDVPA